MPEPNVIMRKVRTPEGVEFLMIVGCESYCWRRDPSETEWQPISYWMAWPAELPAGSQAEQVKV